MQDQGDVFTVCSANGFFVNRLVFEMKSSAENYKITDNYISQAYNYDLFMIIL